MRGDGAARPPGSGHATLIERLCALVPRARHMLVTYQGVLAPAAGWRPRVVPPPPLPDADDPEGCRHVVEEQRVRKGSDQVAHADGPAEKAGSRRPFVPHAPGKPRRPRRRHAWAELLRRVFLIDVLTCPWCGGARRLLAGISDPEAIYRILAHLGLPTEPPELAPARAPPEPLLPW